MYILGIEPTWSRPVTASLVEGDRVLRAFKTREKGSVTDPHDWPVDLRGGDGDLKAAYIETPYKQSLDMIIKISLVAGKIGHYLRTMGTDVYFVTPSTWQSTYLVNPKDNHRTIYLKLKTLHYSMTGIQEEDEDLVASTMIALYGAKHEQFGVGTDKLIKWDALK